MPGVEGARFITPTRELLLLPCVPVYKAAAVILSLQQQRFEDVSGTKLETKVELVSFTVPKESFANISRTTYCCTTR